MMSREKPRPQWCQKHKNWFDLDDGCPNCKVPKGDRGGPGSMSAAEDMAMEITAKCIYEDLMPFDERGSKPAWVENGNSLKQDEARNHARKILGLLPNAAEDDTTRQRELAVIEAAKLWHNCNDHESWQKAGEALIDAVDALTASQPVDPQTLKPGQLFKFAGDEYPESCRAWRKEGGAIGYQNLERGPKFMIYDFEPGNRVIPLPDDTE